MTLPLIQLQNVTKTYGEHHVNALKAIDLTLLKGSFTCIMGQSGCGKSTLLNIIAGLDSPTSGNVIFDSQKMQDLSDEEITRVRGRKIGFIFQFFNLLATLTVEENVALPLEINGLSDNLKLKQKVKEMLAQVGMSERINFYPSQLSGGEMQRVAIARALVHEPLLLVADEPTGNLDSENGQIILELLKNLNQKMGQTIVMATHSDEAAQFGDRVIKMKDGSVIQDSQTEQDQNQSAVQSKSG
ncbi:MAG: transporter ATP-binding protein [Cyanobacteriota bacterium erpe_2018_sw_39hr_WHONDRS-SW48-000098_B_bin.30]|nr:transporter ATP-binding protein [Cyanobacteriota bacterium erpe_2018_sw_39hr_WHONDRS-SW48-000098_B_bin.30]